VYVDDFILVMSKASAPNWREGTLQSKVTKIKSKSHQIYKGSDPREQEQEQSASAKGLYILQNMGERPIGVVNYVAEAIQF
jgi:hypothetical protein